MLISALRMGRGKQGILQECRPPIQKMILETFLDFFLKEGGDESCKKPICCKKKCTILTGHSSDPATV